MNKTLPPVCVVDDDASIREAVESLLRSEGFEVEVYATAQRFMARAQSAPISCLILDVNLPGLSGLDLQEELVLAGIAVPIIFLTANGSIPMSVRAMKAGAFGFLTKPLDPQEILYWVRSAVAEDDPAEATPDPARDLVGSSPALSRLLQQIEKAAPTQATILIQGESGTGKEMIAREIHRLSARREEPLVRVNCASVPKELYESEFFGHVKGAFTGAFRDRIGRFEAAHGGTLFLDEIGEIPLDLQSKLLRALQEKQYERVGDDRTKQADVRIVAATNRDLKQEVAAGRFREDLYYRLNVFPIHVAPLRERREDIPLLSKHFVETFTKDLKGTRPRLTSAEIVRLQHYDWPGNIRELRNVIERAVILAKGSALEFDLPDAVMDDPPPIMADHDQTSRPEYLTDLEMRSRERENLRVVLHKTGWRIKGAHGAAELLGVKPTTLISRVKKMGLKRLDVEVSQVKS